MYLRSRLVRNETETKFYPPCSNSIDGMNQKTWKLRKLNPLSNRRLIEDVEGFCVESGEVGIKN